MSKVPVDGLQVRIIQFIFDLTGLCLPGTKWSQGDTETLPCVSTETGEKLDEREDEAEDDLAQATSSTQVESTFSENTVFWLKVCGPEVYEELSARLHRRD